MVFHLATSGASLTYRVYSFSILAPSAARFALQCHMEQQWPLDRQGIQQNKPLTRARLVAEPIWAA